MNELRVVDSAFVYFFCCGKHTPKNSRSDSGFWYFFRFA